MRVTITYAIGIDPGTSTGVAIWSTRSASFIEMRTLSFWGTYDMIVGQFTPSTTLIVIENPAGNRPTFHDDVRGARRREKVAQNVGQNKREAMLLIERFRALGYHVEAVTPTATKWEHEMFARVTRYPGRVSQHCRDASRLVVGRQPVYFVPAQHAG